MVYLNIFFQESLLVINFVSFTKVLYIIKNINNEKLRINIIEFINHKVFITQDTLFIEYKFQEFSFISHSYLFSGRISQSNHGIFSVTITFIIYLFINIL
jgi:hypothetical protein